LLLSLLGALTPLLGGAIEVRLRADLGECLGVNAESRSSSTNSWRVRAMVSMLVSSASAIRLSLQA
jgi:hypothetical protein